jgi:plasmid stabilization system protein ParE
MPRVIVTPLAVQGLERCRRFLHEKNPDAVERATQQISAGFRKLEATPELGRPFEGRPEWRELVIPFVGAGYSALYRFVINSLEELGLKRRRLGVWR